MFNAPAGGGGHAAGRSGGAGSGLFGAGGATAAERFMLRPLTAEALGNTLEAGAIGEPPADELCADDVLA